jgi:thymidylate kinase
MNKHTGVVIVEGADGTGKTTLATTLTSLTDGFYMHLDYSKTPEVYQARKLQEAVGMSHERLVVIDRHWISENIYAAAYRDGSKQPTIGRSYDRLIQKVAGLYVLCVPYDTLGATCMIYTTTSLTARTPSK